MMIWKEEITGAISNICSYAGAAFERGALHPHDRERLFGYTIAFAVCLKRTLRNETDIDELKSVLSKEDLKQLKEQEDLTAHCLYVLHGYIVEAMKSDDIGLPGPFFTFLMSNVTLLAAAESKCKRIQEYRIAYGECNIIVL